MIIHFVAIIEDRLKQAPISEQWNANKSRRRPPILNTNIDATLENGTTDVLHVI